MKCLAYIAALALCITSPAYAQTPPVANDGYDAALIDDATATTLTKQTFNILKRLTRKSASNVSIGQHFGGPKDWNPAVEETDLFDMRTYRIPSSATATESAHNNYPRVVGARYDANDASDTYVLNAYNINGMNARLIDTYIKYRPLISITATPLNPWSRSSGRKPSDFDLPLARLNKLNRNDVINYPDAHDFWADIDIIADGLAGLQLADGTPIPVLFRPFAEVNTGKYYFRNQSPADFVALWKQVHHYLVNNRGLHNLIFCWEAWVWERSSNKTPSEVDITPWWPGSDEVDVVAGAFYFKPGNNYYDLANLPSSGDDHDMFYGLMSLAVANNKPFGAAQYGLDFDDPGPGDHANTLEFMTDIDALHADNAQRPAATRVQHMSFIYYWSDDMQVQAQVNAPMLVSDPRTS